MTEITRREMLLRMAATAETIAGASLLSELNSFGSSPHKLHVIVVGAGMAGLCAAYELEQRGHKVTLLEAEGKHIGGRVRTVRYADGQYGELGAMRIPHNHQLTRQYIKKFGLPLRKFVQYNPNAYYFEHGKRRRNRDVPHRNHRYTLGMDASAGSEWAQQFDEIVGGMDTLAAAFVSRLKSKPRLGCIATRFEQDVVKRQAAVVFRASVAASSAGSSEHRIEGDYILCTLPAPVLAKIKAEPAFSRTRRAAMAALPYHAANKVIFETSSRFWETDDQIFGGATYTDLPTELAYYPSDNCQAKDTRIWTGPGVLLASYTIGPPALHYAALKPETSADEALHTLARVHPQLLRHGMIRQSLSWSWSNHPWSLGGFAAPGKRIDLNTRLSAPEGRIYFAGEYLSAHRTWIQGALESAVAAVRGILEDAGRGTMRRNSSAY